MNIPKELKFTKTHEWVRQANGRITVGITDYAQHEISDVVFVELPQVAKLVEGGKGVAIVESVKAAFDIYAPVTGEVKAINTMLESDPAIVNQDPYAKGWFFELAPKNPDDINQLMTADQYEQMIRQTAKK